MLLLLLCLLPAVRTTEPPSLFQKTIHDCPSEGYFFERQPQPGFEPAPCYLCLCKGDEQAVCTLRYSERCGKDYSHRTDVEETTVRKSRRRKHRRRPRRSPGLMDVFFQDKKKDQILKSMKETNDEDCAPKASKSIGCPPKDWCTGCLVCDCNDGGKWECHVMSFCENKTPQPPSNNIKKPDFKNSVAPENIVQNKISTKSVQAKKTFKRSAKPKKNKTTSILLPKKNISTSQKMNFKKKLEKTTSKPAIPLISVITKTSFPRKNKSNEVVVIKKYISTISPIESPELLKYRNDSRKLAQILYQLYENSSKETKDVKREIITHAYTKKKDNYAVANSNNLGEKIFSKKPIQKLKLKNSAMGQKSMKFKEYNNRNTKIKTLKEKREKTSVNNFFEIQKELMETADNQIKKKQKKVTNKDIKAYYDRMKKNKLIALASRNKRDVLLIMEASNSTTMDNETVNTTSVNIDQVSETPAESFTDNKKIASSLSNYKYAIDNIVSQNYSGNEINNGKGDETTLNDVITVYGSEIEDKNVTNMDIVNYSYTEDGTTENPKQSHNISLTPNVVDFNEMVKQTEELHLKYNHSVDTTIAMDYNLNGTELPDRKIVLKENSDISTTTFPNKFAFELSNTGKLHSNDKIMHEFSNYSNNTAKKVYANDIDTIIMGFDTSKLKKIVKTNESKEINNTFTVSSRSGPIHKHFSKHEKYRPKNRLVAFKYLKKIYSTLLSYNNNKTGLNNYAVMESLCDTFGPCKISSKSVKAINTKITELVSETKKALNVIKTIKSSLQLIEEGKNNTGNITEEVKFKNYVIKLSSILTNNYETPMKEHEMTRIKNIKSNTKHLINSVGKFAFLLNDILKIIRLDKIKYNNLKKHKTLLKKITTPKVDGKLLHEMKILLKQINLLQNTFMRKMYQIVSDLEMQNNRNDEAVDTSKNDQNNDNYKRSVKKYMNKINYNLTKLKDFALKMGTSDRRKRHATDDNDAVEYLLTLIEYLLRLNNPINYPPITDGIDLLIDTIRRAPDIKPIRKTLLQGKSTDLNRSYVKESSKSSSESNDENISRFNNETDTIKDNLSLETWFNDTDTLPSNFDNKLVEYEVTTPHVSKNMFTEAAKHVDVEDFVFNGNKLQNVYIATFPPYENTEDYFVKEEVTSKSPKKLASKKKSPVVSDLSDETFVMNTTNSKTEKNIPKVTETPVKSHFDLLNEEYEKTLKVQIPKVQTIKMKHKKTKHPKNKSKLNGKSDVSSISTEIDDEKNRKKLRTKEAMLKKRINNVVDDDLLRLAGDENSSKDFSSIDSNSDHIAS